jgi:hypothetical protein
MFIVPDHVVYLDTDNSSSDTTQSESGDSSGNSSDTNMIDITVTAPEDVNDLTIDMQPRYAYNARILARAKKM